MSDTENRPENFAKLVDAGDKFGEVCVFKQRSPEDGSPALVVHANTRVGIASVTVSFPDSEEGYYSREVAFETADELEGLNDVLSALHQNIDQSLAEMDRPKIIMPDDQITH